MKLTLVLTLAFTLLVSATPGSTVHNAADVAKVAANPGSIVAMVDCEDCKNRYQFCFDNGRTKGEEGCAKTCAEHVVYQTPDCRKCGDKLGETPEESRYHVACGDKRC